MLQIITYIKKEAKRILPMLIFAGLILIPDSGSFVVVYSLGITILVSIVSHLIRKILFPYVDLEKFSDKALESPIAASIVFLSISMILAVIIGATCVLLS